LRLEAESCNRGAGRVKAQKKEHGEGGWGVWKEQCEKRERAWPEKDKGQSVQQIVISGRCLWPSKALAFALFLSLFASYAGLVQWNRRCSSAVEKRHMASAEGTGWPISWVFGGFFPFLARRVKIICTMKQEDGACPTDKQTNNDSSVFMFIDIYMYTYSTTYLCSQYIRKYLSKYVVPILTVISSCKEFTRAPVAVVSRRSVLPVRGMSLSLLSSQPED
jgi:hypothetical protein